MVSRCAWSVISKIWFNHQSCPWIFHWIWMVYLTGKLIKSPFVCSSELRLKQMSRDMRFPTMWYVRPAKAKTSLPIRAYLTSKLIKSPSCFSSEFRLKQMSRDMRFPTMWYVRPAKAQTSLRIRADWPETLLVAWILYEFKLLAQHHQFLSLTGGCTGSSNPTLVKMPRLKYQAFELPPYVHILSRDTKQIFNKD